MRWIATWLLLCRVAVGQVEFDGNNQLINTQQSFEETFRNPFSVSMWISLDDGRPASTRVLVGSETPIPANRFLVFLLTNGNFITSYYANNIECRIDTLPLFSDGYIKEFQYTVVTDGTNMTAYINGDISSTKSMATVNMSIYTNALDFYIGDRNYSTQIGSMDGTITDFRIYNKVLSESEIKEIATPETAWALADDPDLVLRTCIVTNDTGSTLTGIAPNLNGLDGTYSNSPTAASTPLQLVKPKRATINID